MMFATEPRSSRELLELIAELECEREKLARRAVSIYERVSRGDRDFTITEDAEFWNIADDKDGDIARLNKRLIQLNNELDEAENRNREIARAATRRGATEAVMVVNSRTGRPEKILPTNGVLPADERRSPLHVTRTGRLKAFRDEQSAYDGGMWLKAFTARAIQGSPDTRLEQYCEDRGLGLTNVGTEGSGPAGGYLVPAPLASTIIDVREIVGAARKICRILPMTSDTLTVPRRTAGLTVYAPGEGAAITASDITLGQIELIAKKRAVYSEISQELVDDSIISIADDVFSEMGHALALQEDLELINGDGSGATYFGVNGLLSKLGAGGVYTAPSGDDTWAELAIDDFASTVAKLPDRYHAYGPSWVCSHAFFNAVMARIAFSAGGVSMAEVMSGSPNVRSFMGFPVYMSSRMPVATAVSQVSCLFGAWSVCAYLGDRTGIRLARSDDFKFSQDLVALRATSRYDFNVFDSGDASNAGAYVGLKTAAS